MTIDSVVPVGLSDQSQFAYLLVIVLYLSSVQLRDEATVRELKWCEPLGMLVARAKDVSTTRLTELGVASVAHNAECACGLLSWPCMDAG